MSEMPEAMESQGPKFAEGQNSEKAQTQHAEKAEGRDLEKAKPSKKGAYDWLDDPFDEKKSEQERADAMTRGSKLAIGGGCLAIVAGVVLMVIVAFGMLGSLL